MRASGKALMSTVLKRSMTKSLLQCKKKKSRMPMGTQKVPDTKEYHTVQLATENKAVEKEISDHEMENDSPEFNRPNLRPSP